MLKLMPTLILGVMLVACGGARPPSAVTQRDSAGITIVESAAPRWSSNDAWWVDPNPSLDLATSGTGPPHEFFRVQDATRLGDGSIAVADRGSGELRFFSSHGEFLQAVGREGEGPGEFRRLTSIDRFRGDSLMAFDYWLGRATVLAPEWQVARIISPYSLDVRLWEMHPLDESDLVAVQYARGFTDEMTEGLYRMPYHIVRLSATGELVDTLAGLLGFEGFMFSGGDARPLFAKSGHFAVHRGKVYVGSADLMQFEVYSAAGQLEHIIRVPDYDLRLSAAEIRVERDAHMPPDLPQRFRNVVEAMPDPESRPAYSDLLVDSEGCVWAAEFHGQAEIAEPMDWELFSPEGEWFGSVRLPARFTAFEIGSDYVLGKWLDASDVEHVQLLRLERRDPRATARG